MQRSLLSLTNLLNALNLHCRSPGQTFLLLSSGGNNVPMTENADIVEYLKLVCNHILNQLGSPLKFFWQEVALTTEMHTTTCLTSEMFMPRSIQSRPSRTEPCNGNGKQNVPQGKTRDSLTWFIQECYEANISGGTWFVLAPIWIIPALASWQSLWGR